MERTAVLRLGIVLNRFSAPGGKACVSGSRHRFLLAGCRVTTGLPTEQGLLGSGRAGTNGTVWSFRIVFLSLARMRSFAGFRLTPALHNVNAGGPVACLLR